MDEQSLNQWKEIVDQAQEALRSEEGLKPGELNSILSRLQGVQSAINKMRQGSVTPKKLSDAVRDSLKDLLQSESGDLIPQLSELSAQLSEVESQFQNQIKQVQEAAENQHGLLSSQLLDAFEGKLAEVHRAVDDRLGAIQAMVGSLPRVLPLRDRIDKLSQRLEELEATIRGDIQAKFDQVQTQQSRQNHDQIQRENAQLEGMEVRFDVLDESLGEISCQFEKPQADLEKVKKEISHLRSENEDLRRELNEKIRPPEEAILNREQIMRHLVLDLRDLLSQSFVEEAAQDSHKPKNLWFKKKQKKQSGEGLNEDLKYKLQCLLEQIESFILKP